MRLCKLLIWSILALFAGCAAPAVADTTITVQGAAVRYRCWMDGWQFSRYEARRSVAMGYDHCTLVAASTVCLTPYGQVTSNAPTWADWNAEYLTEVDVVARWTHGMYVGAELAVRGRERADVYADAMPGCRWLSAGIAGTLQSNLTYWQPGEWTPPPPSYGCEGAENLDATTLHIPLSASVDYWFFWWLRNPGQPTAPFLFLPMELGVAEADWSGRADVTIETWEQNIPYQPPTWTPCRERATVTITIPTIAEVTARECDDLNGDGVVGVADVFLFLTCWFENDARADWSGDAVCGIEDVFAYLTDFFGSV